MNDEPRKVLIGTFPSGLGAVASFSDIGQRLVAEAEAKLDAERAEREERERVARRTVRVDRAWLLSILREMIARVEQDRAEAGWWGDTDRRRIAARRARRLREDLAACNAIEPPR